MKKIIFKFWLINFLISIALFVIYRVVIAQTESVDKNMFETFLSILDILLNLGFSVIYFIGMVICSLTFFLNLIGNIRNNYLLSFLSFLGFPSVCVIYLMINLLTDIYSYKESLLTTLVVFSVISLFFTAIEFLIFRRKIKTYELNKRKTSANN